MAVVDNAPGVTLNASGLDMKTKQILNVGAPTTPTGAATRGDVDASQVVIQAVTTGALPAYTITSGSVAAGTAVFTANANGAFPTLDGNATVTASASEAVSSRFLLTQGASNLDNCVLSLTTQGDAGTKWVASMLSTLNTSANILGSKLRVIAGEQCAGAEYQHMYEGSFTLGTNPYYPKRLDWRMGPNEGSRGNAYCHASLFTQAVPNDSEVTMIFAGTGMTATQLNSTGRLGEYQFVTGSTSTALGGIGCVNFPCSANVDIEIGGEIQVPTLSTAAQEFIENWGAFVVVGGAVIVNGFCFVYDRLNKGTNIWCKTVSGGTSTGTFTDSGITMTAGRRYRWKIIRRAGDTAARFYIGSSADTFALVATHSANHPTGVDLNTGAFFGKTAGTTSVTAMTVAQLNWDIQFPTRLAA